MLCVRLCQGLFKDTTKEIQIQFKHTTKEIPAASSSVIQRELCRMGCRWQQKGIFVSSKAIDGLQRSSILPCASVYLSVIPGGSRGCPWQAGGGWQGGSAGSLMQPSSLGRIQELGRTQQRVTDWKGERGKKKPQPILKGKFHFREDNSSRTRTINQNHKITSDVRQDTSCFSLPKGLISATNHFNDVAEGGRGFDSE